MNYNVIKSKSYNKPYDINISTNIYKKYTDTKQSLFKIEKKLNIEKKEYWKLVNLNYLLEYIIPNNFLKIKDIKNKKIIINFKKRIPISYWFGEKTYLSILHYNYFTSNFPKVWEILFKFKISDTKKKINLLEISNIPLGLEAFFHYREKYYPKYKDNINFLLLGKCNDKLSYSINIIKLLRRFIKLNMFIEKECFSYKYNKIKNKYDLLIINTNMDLSNLGYYWEQSNDSLKIQTLIYALIHQETHGNMIYIVNECKTKFTADILLILKHYYEEVILYRPETQSNYKQTGISVICKNFNNNTISPELFKLADDMYCKFFNIIDNKLRNKYGVKKEIENKNPTYFLSILDLKDTDPQYDWIRNYNMKTYLSVIEYINELKELFFKCKQNKNWNDVEDKMKENQMLNSVMWANKYQLEVKTVVKDKNLINELSITIISDIYNVISPSIHTFKKYKSDLKIEISDCLPSILDIAISKFNLATRYIDTRNITLYDKVSDKIRYYKHTLNKIIMEQCNEKFVSQSFIKMYEILVLFKLIKNKTENYKFFFLCEAPGGFILAVNNYINTYTNIKQFDWKAQTLSPKKSHIGDTYKLIKRYPHKWDFGKNKTGDITNINNIKHYKNNINNSNLVTSDCGIPLNNDTYNRDLNLSEKILYSSVLTIINGLKKGSDTVIKNYMELCPIKISVIYILYSCFKKLHFYKSLQNPMSTEFYIIGIDFQGIEKSILDKMFEFLKHFDFNKSLFKSYPQSFMFQFTNIYLKLVKEQETIIKRTLFYVDNYDYLKKSHLDNMDEYINNKNQEWLNMFKIKEIPSNKKL